MRPVLKRGSIQLLLIHKKLGYSDFMVEKGL